MTSWSSAAAIRDEFARSALSDGRNHFAMAPGGGIDLPFSERGAIRLGASLRLIRTETFTPTGSEPYTFREFQFTTGIVFR
jgi:hypothetical protein